MLVKKTYSFFVVVIGQTV